MSEPLPEILPADPLPLAARWIGEAAAAVKSATAMALAWLTYTQHVPATGPRLEQQHLALGAPDLTAAERTTLERLRNRIKGIAWTHYQGPIGQ